jgi:amidohydrolase
LGVTLSPEVIDILPSLLAWRRAFHAEPELSGEERHTQASVLSALAKCGVRAEGKAGTGVVGLIEGPKPGPVVLLRADMDALPIDEANDVDYRSARPGVMHACGHDAHMAILLGAAKLLAAAPPSRGAVKLMFQPAEERADGARRMLDAGVLEAPKVDAALAFHVWSGFDIGTVAALDGPAMAAVDSFTVTVRGKGGHAAMPEECADPILAAAHLITAAQALISRRKAAHDPAVLSFTAVHSGAAHNVIPDHAELWGTLRTLAPDTRAALWQALCNLTDGVAKGLGVTADIQRVEDLAPTLNDPKIAALVRRLASDVVGPDRVISPKPLLGGEDMGLVLARVPGAMVWLGCKNPAQDAVYAHHHPRFAIDERVLPVGVELALAFVRAVTSGLA